MRAGRVRAIAAATAASSALGLSACDDTPKLKEGPLESPDCSSGAFPQGATATAELPSAQELARLQASAFAHYALMKRDPTQVREQLGRVCQRLAEANDLMTLAVRAGNKNLERVTRSIVGAYAASLMLDDRFTAPDASQREISKILSSPDRTASQRDARANDLLLVERAHREVTDAAAKLARHYGQVRAMTHRGDEDADRRSPATKDAKQMHEDAERVLEAHERLRSYLGYLVEAELDGYLRLTNGGYNAAREERHHLEIVRTKMRDLELTLGTQSSMFGASPIQAAMEDVSAALLNLRSASYQSPALETAVKEAIGDVNGMLDRIRKDVFSMSAALHSAGWQTPEAPYIETLRPDATNLERIRNQLAETRSWVREKTPVNERYMTLGLRINEVMTREQERRAMQLQLATHVAGLRVHGLTSAPAVSKSAAGPRLNSARPTVPSLRGKAVREVLTQRANVALAPSHRAQHAARQLPRHG